MNEFVLQFQMVGDGQIVRKLHDMNQAMQPIKDPKTGQMVEAGSVRYLQVMQQITREWEKHNRLASEIAVREGRAAYWRPPAVTPALVTPAPHPAGRYGERIQFRLEQRAEHQIAGMLGLETPVSKVVGQFEYLKFMAAHAGTSIGGLLIKALPMIGLGAVVAGVAKAFKGLADEGAKALETVGVKSNSFWLNINAALGTVNIINYKLRDMSEIMERISGNSERMKAGFSANERRAGAAGGYSAGLETTEELGHIRGKSARQKMERSLKEDETLHGKIGTMPREELEGVLRSFLQQEGQTGPMQTEFITQFALDTHARSFLLEALAKRVNKTRQTIAEWTQNEEKAIHDHMVQRAKESITQENLPGWMSGEAENYPREISKIADEAKMERLTGKPNYFLEQLRGKRGAQLHAAGLSLAEMRQVIGRDEEQMAKRQHEASSLRQIEISDAKELASAEQQVAESKERSRHELREAQIDATAATPLEKVQAESAEARQEAENHYNLRKTELEKEQQLLIESHNRTAEEIRNDPTITDKKERDAKLRDEYEKYLTDTVVNFKKQVAAKDELANKLKSIDLKSPIAVKRAKLEEEGAGIKAKTTQAEIAKFTAERRGDIEGIIAAESQIAKLKIAELKNEEDLLVNAGKITANKRTQIGLEQQLVSEKNKAAAAEQRKKAYSGEAGVWDLFKTKDKKARELTKAINEPNVTQEEREEMIKELHGIPGYASKARALAGEWVRKGGTRRGAMRIGRGLPEKPTAEEQMYEDYSWSPGGNLPFIRDDKGHIIGGGERAGGALPGTRPKLNMKTEEKKPQAVTIVGGSVRVTKNEARFEP